MAKPPLLQYTSELEAKNWGPTFPYRQILSKGLYSPISCMIVSTARLPADRPKFLLRRFVQGRKADLRK